MTLNHYLKEFEDKKSLRLFFSLVKELIITVGLNSSNEKLAFTFRNDKKRLHVNLNGRLVFGIERNADFIFMANCNDSDQLVEVIKFIKKEQFKKQLPEANLFYISKNQFVDNLNLIKPLWLKSCQEYEPTQEKSEYRSSHIPLLYDLAKDYSKLSDIIKETDPREELITKYKEHIKAGGLTNEIYKWKLVQKFQNRPNLESDNFQLDFQEIDSQNLVYPMSKAVKKRLLEFDVKKYKNCISKLFNEDTDLNIRINDFENDIKTLYKESKGKNSHHHDERTISVYLTIKYPEKYTFYKNSYYMEYCNFLNIKTKNSKKKYTHYLELINELINDYIIEDDELLSLINEKTNYPDLYKDPKHLILAQDILYQMFDVINKNYWVFQGNPSIYRISDALNANLVKSWSVAQHKKEIKEGDKIILWVTGENAGVYALATVTSEVQLMTDSKEDAQFYINSEDNKLSERVKINIDYNLVEKPLLKKGILAIPELESLIQGKQGTNFSANELQYNTILKMISMKSNNNTLNQILYGPPGTGKTYNTINKAIEIINPNFNFKQDRKEIKEEFERLVNDGQIVFTTFHQSMCYEDFIEGIKPEIDESEKKDISYTIEDGIFKRLCVDSAFSFVQQNPTQDTENALGFSEGFDNFVEFLTDELDKQIEVTLETKNGGHVIVDSISQNNNIIITYTKNSTKYIVSKDRLGKLSQAFPDLSLVKSITEEFRKAIGGCTPTPYWAVLSEIRKRQNIKPKKTEKVENKVYTYEDKKSIIKTLKETDYSVDNQQKYVLIIDEINRGNVSQIFGELITLIEDDKRLGKPEALEVILPYSKEKFGVPPNLHVIGTMNTADRSVEALDTALRRRFSFEEMPAKPEIIKTEGKATEGMIGEINLTDILTIINQRIEILLDKDHQIGHSYFLCVSNLEELKSSFQHKIIPLLQEYFYGDYGKIGLVLGKGFVSVFKSKKVKLFADFSNEYDDTDYSEKTIYSIEKATEMDDAAFNEAINSLLNN